MFLLQKVRKEAVRTIAPNIITIPKIIERIRDIDHSVRVAAYRKCSDISPALQIRIVDRQTILICGFVENHKLAREAFLETLVPKWLTSFNGDFLKFLSDVKLDADEEDLENTVMISKNLVDVFLK